MEITVVTLVEKQMSLWKVEEPVDQANQAFLEEVARLKRQEKEADDAAKTLRKEFAQGIEDLLLQAEATRASSTNYASTPVHTASPSRVLKSDKADDDESHLFKLPPHVLENLIMEFCAGVDYLNFRATCKHCHLAAPLIPWNNRKASKIMQNYPLPSPWLIVFDKHKGIMTLTDPMFGDKYFIKTPQEFICDFQIKCSRFGWLLILKPGGSLVFFNPFTKDILELPELPDKFKVKFCFSAPPTSPDCMVVGNTIGSGSPYHACIHIVGGEPSWRRLSLNVR
ncbi:hypothetical protein Tco_0381698, partial [Tanacetum coccineum]